MEMILKANTNAIRAGLSYMVHRVKIGAELNQFHTHFQLTKVSSQHQDCPSVLVQGKGSGEDDNNRVANAIRGISPYIVWHVKMGQVNMGGELSQLHTNVCLSLFSSCNQDRPSFLPVVLKKSVNGIVQYKATRLEQASLTRSLK